MTAIGPSAYSEGVWVRFCAPRHAGRPRGAYSGCARSLAHHLELCFHYAGGRYFFSAVACPTTIAAADFCAEALNVGRRTDAAELMNALEIGEDHRHCVLLCEDATAALRAKLAQEPSPNDRQAS